MSTTFRWISKLECFLRLKVHYSCGEINLTKYRFHVILNTFHIEYLTIHLFNNLL